MEKSGLTVLLVRIRNWSCYAYRSLVMLPVSWWHWYCALFTGKPWYKKMFYGLLTLFFLLFFYVFGVYVNLLWLFGKMPSIESIMHPETDEASVIYSADGKVLGRFFRENRSNVKYADVDSMFFRTLIDTEDERFYEHHGIDYQGIGAAVKDIIRGNPRGASTITQQLAKNLYRVRTQFSMGLLGHIPGLRMLIMKTKECIIATELEMLYSKKEILEMYVNTVDFGCGAYGIRTAAKTYFGKTPDRLNIEESAVLVGLLKATSTYNPHTNYERALARRNVVLRNLLNHDDVTRAQFDSLCALPIDMSRFRIEKVYDGSAPYLRQEIARLLDDKFEGKELGSVDLYGDGLRIYTAIDSRMQHYAEEAVLAQMKFLQRNFRMRSDVAERYVQTVVRSMPRYKAVRDNADSLRHFLDVELNRIHEVTINNPYTGAETAMMSSRDSIRTMLGFLQAGFVVMEPSTHHVKAWVGNLNFKTWNHDNVVARHQTGSTFKGLVYMAAMEQGWTPCDRIVDKAPETVTLLKSYESGANMYLRSAFKYSKNGAAINLCDRVGVKNVIRLARKCGISDPLYQDCQNLTLGSSSTRLRDLVNAYAVICANGYARKPVIITKVVDRAGNVIYSEEEEPQQQVISRRAAFLMQQLLKSGMEGTSHSLANYVSHFMGDTDFGGKTGTTNESADALYVGVIPNLVGGVWVGGEYRGIHPYGSGASVSLPVWGKFLQKVLGDSRYRNYRTRFPDMRNIAKSCYQCGTMVWVDSDTVDATAGGVDPAVPSAGTEISLPVSATNEEQQKPKI